MTASKPSENETTGQKKPAAPCSPVDNEPELSDEALENVSGGTKPCASGEHFKKATITV